MPVLCQQESHFWPVVCLVKTDLSMEACHAVYGPFHTPESLQEQRWTNHLWMNFLNTLFHVLLFKTTNIYETLNLRKQKCCNEKKNMAVDDL